ncbi:MAG TPA: DUF2569 family protein [Candidatus Sulfotelmatobacter sp.]|nr:DUF2569 family protein [Candidatus Sulfotelmatobacter sp.]
MNLQQSKDAAQLYETWSVAQLLRATTANKQDYEPEALDLMVRELSRRGISQSEREDAERKAEKKVVHQVETEKKRLTGIGGFLVLFVIAMFFGPLLGVLSGLLLLGAGGLDNPSQRFPLVLLSGILSLGLAGYGFYVFYLLLRKRRNAPKHAERYLILGVLLSILVIVSLSKATHHFSPEPLVGCVGALLWLAYLGSSQRVANTYGQAMN